MVKGTPSMGKKARGVSHRRCPRCGKRSFHKSKRVCASCGFGKSKKLRKYNWQKKR